MTWEIRQGDVLDELRKMPDESVNCVVTSPPYWGLRDYGVAGQLGLEKSPEEYVAKIVEIFREVRRVMRSDATLWLNMGDSYASAWACKRRNVVGNGSPSDEIERGRMAPGLKEKDLVGIPWRVAFALQADGWYLRSDIIWAKPNPMPESVIDRPTKSHEYLFLLSKRERYCYDAEAIADKALNTPGGRLNGNTKHAEDWPKGSAAEGRGLDRGGLRETRNKRSVWTVATHPYAGAHFATFPPALVEPCILAGCLPGGLVLDPFSGAGTTVMVALRLGRRGIGIELNHDYVAMSRERIINDAPLLNGAQTVQEDGWER